MALVPLLLHLPLDPVLASHLPPYTNWLLIVAGRLAWSAHTKCNSLICSYKIQHPDLLVQNTTPWSARYKIQHLDLLVTKYNSVICWYKMQQLDLLIQNITAWSACTKYNSLICSLQNTTPWFAHTKYNSVICWYKMQQLDLLVTKYNSLICSLQLQSFDHCLPYIQLSRCFSTPKSLYRISVPIQDMPLPLIWTNKYTIRLLHCNWLVFDLEIPAWLDYHGCRSVASNRHKM